MGAQQPVLIERPHRRRHVTGLGELAQPGGVGGDERLDLLDPDQLDGIGVVVPAALSSRSASSASAARIASARAPMRAPKRRLRSRARTCGDSAARPRTRSPSTAPASTEAS